MSDGFRVVALRADDSGCAFYRIKEPSRAINETHPEIDITVDNGIDVVAYKNSKTGFTSVEHIETDADLIVVQRPLHQWFTSMIQQAHRQGIAVVVELDDDFENVHRKNIVHSNVQPGNHPESNYEWVKKACEIADWVTVSTAALKRYAPHGRVSVLPNYIPRRFVTTHPVSQRSGAVRVGWSGTTQTHPTDLQVTKPAVNQVLRDTDSSLVVVGDGQGVRDALGIARALPIKATGWVHTDSYMSKLQQSMDIGIVPLDHTPFNEAKSCLKGLEMAACGIPFVASPLPEYVELAAMGVGELAKTPGEWRRALSRLIENDYLRVATGEAYRSLVRENYVLEDHVDLWIEAWQLALEFRKVVQKT